MANKRIKDLSTTAAVTASDDFIAVDGATNGTRKLDAYNPTFGGNLTVSGTGTFGGTNLINVSSGTPAFQISNAAGGGGLKTELNYNTSAFVTQLRALATPGSGTIFSLRTIVGGTEQDTLAINYLGNATLSGNLTVSGTGTSTFAGTLSVVNGSTTGILKLQGANGYASTEYYNASSVRKWTTGYDGSNDNYYWAAASGSTAAVFQQSGNFLLGTTTDSGNGKLQLATHTTSAGGIGFGTDTSLYRSASGNLNLYGSGTDSKLLFSHSSSTAGKGFEIQLDSSKDLYIWQRENRAMYFGTNATTALTLDSSQRTILSGALRLNNAYTASAVVPTGYVTIQDSTGTTYKVCVLL